MDTPHHRLAELFAQLGLSSSSAEIGAFIKAHQFLPAHVRIEDAPFWTAAQAALLRDKLHEDADWAELIDQLSVALRP